CLRLIPLRCCWRRRFPLRRVGQPLLFKLFAHLVEQLLQAFIGLKSGKQGTGTHLGLAPPTASPSLLQKFKSLVLITPEARDRAAIIRNHHRQTELAFENVETLLRLVQRACRGMALTGQLAGSCKMERVPMSVHHGPGGM